jgi:hypothetical protein
MFNADSLPYATRGDRKSPPVWHWKAHTDSNTSLRYNGGPGRERLEDWEERWRSQAAKRKVHRVWPGRGE